MIPEDLRKPSQSDILANMGVLRWLILIYVFGFFPSNAQACRQALVLALDVSGSVDPSEYRLQIEGLANALDAPEIRQLILSTPDRPVALAVFEWSSRNHQYLIQPWIELTSDTALDLAIMRIRSHRKIRAGLRTAMGTALQYGGQLLAQRPNCWRHTIDVSGDGRSNIGPQPKRVTETGRFKDVTVNGLVVSKNPRNTSDPAKTIRKQEELRFYFQSNVIHGPGAFVELAEGYTDFERAMRQKLAREMALPLLGSLRQPALATLSPRYETSATSPE
ncbi:DUF1194 domain-containing protein [Algirhabdus cladophorae]|uniref:DUF1194 domain-containing protein n=1 Tax=Algirhabdus cladophorae TaxID=3377108 RepID=UPI003B84A0B5